MQYNAVHLHNEKPDFSLLTEFRGIRTPQEQIKLWKSNRSLQIIMHQRIFQTIL